MNIIILAGGAESAADHYPLWLTEVRGRPLIEHLHAQIQPLQPGAIRLVLSEAEARQYHAADLLALLSPVAAVTALHQRTAGAAASALLAACALPAEEELLLLPTNEYLDLPLATPVQAFRQDRCHAGVVTFDSVHPRYSYVRLEQGAVVEAAEKRPISRQAVASYYWFAHAGEFVRAAKEMLRKDAHVGGVFYICPVLNELILEQQHIGAYAIDKAQYHPLKTATEAERELLRVNS